MQASIFASEVRLKRSFLFALAGIMFAFLVGLLLGGGAVGLFWWAFTAVVREDALDPLAELKITSDELSGDEVDQFVRQLGTAEHGTRSTCMMIGVARGQAARYFAFGKLPDGKAPDRETIFELASVGKTFTGILLADMVLRNDVSLDTPLKDLLPPETVIPTLDGRHITLVDLATQSSGLPNLLSNFKPSNPLNPYADYTVAQMFEGLRSVKLAARPGRSYAYSNLGFGLLGHALAEKAGQDYELAVVETLCNPLGLDSTRMTLSDEMKVRVAKPHDGEKPVEVWEDTTMPGAGSFLSTAKDMTTFMQAHWDETSSDSAGGSADRLRVAMKTAVRKRRKTDVPATAIGLAWHIDSENALDIVWHNGGAGGSRSYVAMLPESKIGVVVLANTTSASVEALGKKVLYLLNLEKRAHNPLMQ